MMVLLHTSRAALQQHQICSLSSVPRMYVAGVQTPWIAQTLTSSLGKSTACVVDFA